MSAVICRHPTDRSWVSFERRGNNWEPFAVSVGSLQSMMGNALRELTLGTFTFSERGVDEVRFAMAHEPDDLKNPALRDVNMTILCPVTEADPSLWGVLRVMRGDVVYPGSASHFRLVNLGNEILSFFTRLTWQSFESNERPVYPRELLVRRGGGWLTTEIAPTPARAAEQEAAKREHREAVQSAYEQKRRAATPTARREAQWEIDRLALHGSKESRAAAEDDRKRQFGFSPSVKLPPQPEPPQPAPPGPDDPQFRPGQGWFVAGTGE